MIFISIKKNPLNSSFKMQKRITVNCIGLDSQTTYCRNRSSDAVLENFRFRWAIWGKGSCLVNCIYPGMLRNDERFYSATKWSPILANCRARRSSLLSEARQNLQRMVNFRLILGENQSCNVAFYCWRIVFSLMLSSVNEIRALFSFFMQLSEFVLVKVRSIEIFFPSWNFDPSNEQCLRGTFWSILFGKDSEKHAIAFECGS